jgi:hypothetical protein
LCPIWQSLLSTPDGWRNGCALLGGGALQRLALEEAAAISWWTGDRVGSDRLALWSSFRIGAAEEDGGGLIRTAWAARRLMAKP